MVTKEAGTMMGRLGLAAVLAGGTLLFTAPAIAADKAPVKSHALTLDDRPKYGADFKHLDYVNPNAPKGGTVRQFSIGSFDSFNPFIIKGDPAAGLGYLFETLMSSPEDDSLTEYGLIAESVEVPGDLSYVIYNLRQEAKFHDGSPITADDVIFSFNILRDKGQPVYRFYYANVARIEALGPRRVKFSFSGPPNRELPQIVGQIPVLSKAYWEKRDFSKTTLEPPVGSGPYKIQSFEPGRYIIYERVKDYWGAKVPLKVGTDNFDTVRYDFVRDQVVALEAFKAGQYDFRLENSSKDWATSYDFPALRDGLVKKASLRHERPAGMQAFVFNIRRDKFKDRLVRQALGYAFDFEWSNRQLFYGQYTRTTSFFENSDLAARELPTPEELKLLEPLRGMIPDEVFTKVFSPPKADGTGNIRKGLRSAARLLRKAGWRIVDNQLINPRDGKPLVIEFLLVSPAFERVVAPFVRNLKRLGVKATIRTVDPAQYQNRVRDFDYDVIVSTFGQSRSPGNEQRNYWSSSAVKRPGSRNWIGISNPAIDSLIEKIVAAPNRKTLIVATRALDRVLQWSYFVIPQWHIREDRVAWWDKFGRPAIKPAYGVGFSSWWVDPKKDAMVSNRQKAKKNK
ncbi:MAG: extracellular solute-binding protein [Proteobacteria bacterium]|nr:extracellular solute-binding protein [Pseudomonadota bacterium]